MKPQALYGFSVIAALMLISCGQVVIPELPEMPAPPAATVTEIAEPELQVPNVAEATPTPEATVTATATPTVVVTQAPTATPTPVPTATATPSVVAHATCQDHTRIFSLDATIYSDGSEDVTCSDAWPSHPFFTNTVQAVSHTPNTTICSVSSPFSTTYDFIPFGSDYVTSTGFTSSGLARFGYKIQIEVLQNGTLIAYLGCLVN